MENVYKWLVLGMELVARVFHCLFLHRYTSARQFLEPTLFLSKNNKLSHVLVHGSVGQKQKI